MDALAFREAIDGYGVDGELSIPRIAIVHPPRGMGAGISREYLFLLASYDFRVSDIYYIRRSAFRAKISFLPRVQYDNSSSLKQRYTRFALSPALDRNLARVSIIRLPKLCIRNEFSRFIWSPLNFEFEFDSEGRKEGRGRKWLF